MDEAEQFEATDATESWTDTEAHYDRYKRWGVRPKTLKSVINRVMARKGYGQRQTDNQVRDAWLEIVPDTLGPQTRVATVRRGVLEVYVGSPMALQQLTFLQHQLIKQLKEKLPSANIKSLRFKLGNQS